MNEQEFLTELEISQNPTIGMLSYLALERCRQYIAFLDQSDSHTKELEILLPRGYQRIPHK